VTRDRVRVLCLSVAIGLVFVLAWQAFAGSRPPGKGLPGERVIAGQSIVSEYWRFPEQPLVSVARTVNVEVPGTEGVPDKTPADERLRPAGSKPLRRLKVYGPAPPLAESVWL